jgi:hypothetical protein
MTDVRRTPAQYEAALRGDLPPFWECKTLSEGVTTRTLKINNEWPNSGVFVYMTVGLPPAWSIYPPTDGTLLAFEDIFLLRPLFELRKVLGGAPLISEEMRRRDDAIAREYDRAGSGGFTGD